ncbi:MAG: ImmA/IrrE family metallo-endopeptidase [Candidatus Giovannonibacteria bacterium]|nr:MAG: ImmA/IrrE family metallo-endopeptidase [Candidatus Giovannonibacteria bacterium]
MSKVVNNILYLSNEMIESHASEDLLKFQKVTGHPLAFPIYPEEVLRNIWGIQVEYLDRVKSLEGEEVLACFMPGTHSVRLNNSMHSVEGSVTFSIAHETGHVSLHNFLSDLKEKPTFCEGSIFGRKALKTIERQADRYASALLIPQYVLMPKLESIGWSLGKKLDLQLHGRPLKEYFGVSFEALERRLGFFGIPTIGGFYNIPSKKIKNVVFEKMEEERASWALYDKRRA